MESGVPGLVIDIFEEDGRSTCLVEFADKVKKVNLIGLEEVQLGSWVCVQDESAIFALHEESIWEIFDCGRTRKRNQGYMFAGTIRDTP